MLTENIHPFIHPFFHSFCMSSFFHLYNMKLHNEIYYLLPAAYNSATALKTYMRSQLTCNKGKAKITYCYQLCMHVK